MAFLKCDNASCLYNVIFAAKSSSKTRFVQYVITAENLFKPCIYALEVMLLDFKKPCTTTILSAGLTALHKAH